MLLKTAGSSPAQEISRARAPAHEIFNRIRKLQDSRIGSQNCQSSCSKTTGSSAAQENSQKLTSMKTVKINHNEVLTRSAIV